MTISNGNRDKINKMNKASQNVSLGTIIQGLQTGSGVQQTSINTLMSASQTANSQITVLQSGSQTHTTQINTLMSASQNINGSVVILMSASQTANSQIVALQAGVMGKSGSITINSTHTNASVVTVDTGVAIKGFIVQVYRSGSPMYGPYVRNSSGSLLVYGNTAGSYVLTANDNINWLAF